MRRPISGGGYLVRKKMWIIDKIGDKPHFIVHSDTFVAIDFETADRGRDSACAVGLVRVEGGKIVFTESRLIRPPRRDFEFTYIHGITWSMVANEPDFSEIWPAMAPILDGATFLAAHNAAFDRSVLYTCCKSAGLEPPPISFQCTVALARKQWGLYPTKLPTVCRHLGIDLNHHDPGSDATACAQIILAAFSSFYPEGYTSEGV